MYSMYWVRLTLMITIISGHAMQYCLKMLCNAKTEDWIATQIEIWDYRFILMSINARFSNWHVTPKQQAI